MKNLKKFTLLLCLLSLSVSGFAQLHFGVKGGLNYSTVSASEYKPSEGPNPEFVITDLDYKSSYHIGMLVQYRMQDFAIESGAYYSVQGGKGVKKVGAAKYEVRADPAYLQIPVLLLYKFNVSDKFKLYPTIGTFVAYGLSGKINKEYTANGNNIHPPVSEDYFNGNVRKIDWGTSAGLNLEYNKFVLGVAYEYGFLRVNSTKVEGNAQTKGKNAHNKNFKASVAYVF
ncbi:hypothetical protein AwDysgo_08050 [Bacteroidales bacterium]|nr:hypothetical protein AwDysgo_08050 [Bacteroidales bacterium]